MDTLYERNRRDKYLIYVDSKENPIDSLESILLFLEREDNLKWKWIIFALHHSLYQFCVANLEGSNFEQVLSRSRNPDEGIIHNKGMNEWKISTVRSSNNLPLYRINWKPIQIVSSFKKKIAKGNKKIIGFWSAIARVQDSELFMARWTISKAIVFSDDEEKSIVKLADLRNDLMHFVPMLLSIDIGYVKEILINILNVIERLSFETHQFMFTETEYKDRIKNSLKDITDKCVL